MKRTDSQNLGNVIMEYLRATGLETPLQEYRVISAWPEVIGSALAAYTQDVKIFNRTLFVKVSSAAVRNELMMRRMELVARLNSISGAQTITQIVLR